MCVCVYSADNVDFGEQEAPSNYCLAIIVGFIKLWTMPASCVSFDCEEPFIQSHPGDVEAFGFELTGTGLHLSVTVLKTVYCIL